MALREEIVSSIAFVLRLRIGRNLQRALGLREETDARILADQIVTHLERCRIRFSQEPPPAAHSTSWEPRDDHSADPATVASPMTSFHEVRFPDNMAYGATGGPEFATTVVATGAGHEKRNVNWAEARGRWDVASGLKKQAQIDQLIAFFRARRGKAHGFRFKDWTDYKAIGQGLGTGDGTLTQFQLLKHYPSGSAIEVRTITKPVAGTVKVYLAGVEQLSGWSVDTTTGLITFGTPPALGLEVTADFEFDVPARFDTDHMAVTIETYRLHAWQQIPIVELRT